VSDAEELVELDDRSSVYRLDGGPCSTFVVRVDGFLVGKTQLVEAVPGIGYLTDMVVAETRRRCGIGRALVAAVERQAWMNGSRSMLLASTDMGRHLYESLGYEVDCWLHSYVPATRT
jgi:GNAT superfamily N-acetyltransferase